MVRIKVSFNFLNISPDVKLFLLIFFSSGIKSVFCIAANSCDPALEFLKGVICPELFHAYLSIFKKPRKSLLLRQTMLDLTLSLCWERAVAV